MLKRLALCAGAALVALAATATPAQAALVNFSTAGVFASTGTNSVTINGVTITFVGVSETVLTPTQESLGAFVVSGGSGSFEDITLLDDFTLTVTQTLPGPPGQGTFTADLHGSIRIAQSQAYVQFDGSLSTTINGITYTIIEADGGVAGRANLNPPKPGGAASNPSTVGAEIVPEPSSLVMFGMALFGAAGAFRRRFSA